MVRGQGLSKVAMKILEKRSSYYKLVTRLYCSFGSDIVTGKLGTEE